MWQALLNQLYQYYNSIGKVLTPNEINYLSKAFNDIDSSYNSNLTNLKVVNYIMLSEAPLRENKFIYNPLNYNDSSFFRVKNMRDALNIKGRTSNTSLITKQNLVTELNLMGFLIIDVCPFALNLNDTSISY